MNRRAVLLGLALAVTLWLTFFGGQEVEEEISQPVVRGKPLASAKTGSSATPLPRSGSSTGNASTTSRAPSRANTSASAIAILALQDRTDLLGQSAPPPVTKPGKAAKGKPVVPEAAKPEPLFDSQTWNPPPPPPPKPTPAPPPVAPPLPYLVLGKKLEDQNWEVYLARGEQTFIAREKGTLENQYRVESIKPPTMTLTYLPLNQVQTLTIGGID